jgi:hypothetical protein
MENSKRPPYLFIAHGLSAFLRSLIVIGRDPDTTLRSVPGEIGATRTVLTTEIQSTRRGRKHPGDGNPKNGRQWKSSGETGVRFFRSLQVRARVKLPK